MVDTYLSYLLVSKTVSIVAFGAMAATVPPGHRWKETQKHHKGVVRIISDQVLAVNIRVKSFLGVNVTSKI
jgi:hypothetical protein